MSAGNRTGVYAANFAAGLSAFALVMRIMTEVVLVGVAEHQRLPGGASSRGSVRTRAIASLASSAGPELLGRRQLDAIRGALTTVR